MSDRPATRRARLCVAAAAVLAVAACTDDGDGGDSTPLATTTTVAPATTVPDVTQVADGRLRIGLLLPGGAPLVADAIETTAQLVVDEINDAGGVLGDDVDLVTIDEGGSAADVSQAVTDLVARDVDAIVGPISSTTAISAIDVATAGQVVTCSPTATAAILDDAPDNNLFFRTIASDSMQAIAIAEAAENTGARTVAIVHVDDAYGRPYAEAVTAGLEERSLRVVETVGFAIDEDLTDLGQALAAVDAEVLVLVAAGNELASALSAIGVTGVRFDTVITNDEIRTPANQPVIAELPPALRARLLGIAPQITDRREGADGTPFAPQVTDCITLLALATVQADSDDARLIAGQMPPVSAGGRLCRSFDACASQIELDRQIDYNGPTGLTELDRLGETARAWFERFTFDDDGTDRHDDDARLQISR